MFQLDWFSRPVVETGAFVSVQVAYLDREEYQNWSMPNLLVPACRL